MCASGGLGLEGGCYGRFCISGSIIFERLSLIADEVHGPPPAQKQKKEIKRRIVRTINIICIVDSIIQIVQLETRIMFFMCVLNLFSSYYNTKNVTFFYSNENLGCGLIPKQFIHEIHANRAQCLTPNCPIGGMLDERENHTITLKTQTVQHVNMLYVNLHA